MVMSEIIAPARPVAAPRRQPGPRMDSGGCSDVWSTVMVITIIR